MQFREATKQRRQVNLSFHAREGRPEAEVCALAKRDMLIWLPREIENIGIGELRLVMIGRSDHGDDQMALLDVYRSNRQVLARKALRSHIEGAAVTQKLLDG